MHNFGVACLTTATAVAETHQWLLLETKREVSCFQSRFRLGLMTENIVATLFDNLCREMDERKEGIPTDSLGSL